MNTNEETRPVDGARLLADLAALPDGWHASGSLSRTVLEAFVKHCSRFPIRHSMETGCGKSTLLFSRLSGDHKVFCLEPRVSSKVRIDESPLFESRHVEFILGPTQQTLPVYRFVHPLDAALLDGPHAYPFPDLEYYFTYRHLAPGAVLIVDDIDIPCIANMFRILSKDAMFELAEVVRTTAFFYRTDAPVFDPFGDSWWEQGFNQDKVRMDRLARRVRGMTPRFVVSLLRRLRGIS